MRWAPYVPVAKRRANAAKKMAKLAKKGQTIQPIEIQGRTIARSFWWKHNWLVHKQRTEQLWFVESRVEQRGAAH